jgi:hypothetical protein
LHGPEAIDDQEFFTRIGMELADARQLLSQRVAALARPR